MRSLEQIVYDKIPGTCKTQISASGTNRDGFFFLLTISLNDATHFDERIDMSEQDLDRISVFSLLGTVIINQGLIWMNLN